VWVREDALANAFAQVVFEMVVAVAGVRMVMRVAVVAVVEVAEHAVAVACGVAGYHPFVL